MGFDDKAWVSWRPKAIFGGAMKMSLREQASYDHMKCKSKWRHNLYLVRRSNLGYNYLGNKISLGE